MKKTNQPTDKADSSAGSRLGHANALKARKLYPASFQTCPYDKILLQAGYQRVFDCTTNAEVTNRGTLPSYLLLF